MVSVSPRCSAPASLQACSVNLRSPLRAGVGARGKWLRFLIFVRVGVFEGVNFRFWVFLFFLLFKFYYFCWFYYCAGGWGGLLQRAAGAALRSHTRSNPGMASEFRSEERGASVPRCGF